MKKKENNLVTVVILSANEGDVISKAISSGFLLTNNIIVVDSYSTDDTVKIAKKMLAKVIVHKFKDFADQRNFALEQIKTPWVFYLDSDEVMTQELVDEIDSIIGQNANVYGGYFVGRDTYYFGKNWNMRDHVQRLFRREFLKKWEGVVHETPIINGEFGYLENSLRHYTHRSLSQMVQKTNSWSVHEAQLRFETGHPAMNPFRFIRVIATGFFRSYIKDKGYRNGTYGIIESMYQAFSMFITYAKLWEMQELTKREKERRVEDY